MIDLHIARFYWPADVAPDELPLPDQFYNQAGTVALKLQNVVLTQDSADALLDPLALLDKWFSQHQIDIGSLCGVIIDNYAPPEHPDSAQIERLFDLLAEELDVIPVIKRNKLLHQFDTEHFFEQISALHEFNQLLQDGITAHKLINFHTRYKMLCLAHSQPAYRELGPLIANLKQKASIDEFAHQYRQHFMRLLRYPATVQNHTNVLMHMQGYFRQQISSELRQQLTQIIHEFRLGTKPLAEVKATLRSYLQLAPHGWLRQQRYLYPWLIN